MGVWFRYDLDLCSVSVLGRESNEDIFLGRMLPPGLVELTGMMDMVSVNVYSGLWACFSFCEEVKGYLNNHFFDFSSL